VPRLRDLAVDLAPLRSSPDFRRLSAGLLLSGIGSRLTDVAVPFHLYARTGSTVAVGALGAVTFGPRLVASLVGGALADRHDRRRLLAVCEAVACLASAALALAVLLGVDALGVIYAATFVAACASSVATPAAGSAIPLLVERRHLTAAMALRSITGGAGFLVGPAIGGVVLATWGVGACYAIDAVTFVAVFVALARMAPIPPVGDRPARGSTGRPSTVRDVVAGLRELRRRPAVLGSFLADVDAMVFGLPIAVFPALVALRFPGEPAVLGLLYAAPFAGSVVASATSGWTSRVHRHGVAVTACIVVWGLAIAALGLVGGLAASLACLAVAGAADMVSGVFRMAMLAHATPPELLGRMEGAGMAVWSAGPALGDLEAGTAAALLGVEASIVAGGLACVAGALVLAAVLPAFRRCDARA
jgi:MFS family permease